MTARNWLLLQTVLAHTTYIWQHICCPAVTPHTFGNTSVALQSHLATYLWSAVGIYLRRLQPVTAPEPQSMPQTLQLRVQHIAKQVLLPACGVLRYSPQSLQQTNSLTWLVWQSSFNAELCVGIEYEACDGCRFLVNLNDFTSLAQVPTLLHSRMCCEMLFVRCIRWFVLFRIQMASSHSS